MELTQKTSKTSDLIFEIIFRENQEFGPFFRHKSRLKTSKISDFAKSSDIAIIYRMDPKNSIP